MSKWIRNNARLITGWEAECRYYPVKIVRKEMRIIGRAKNRIGNKGYSLVELIVVIAIMAIMVGVTSLGIGMMFTRDANYVAVRIDDELTEARTLAMSRAGTFTYVLHADNSGSSHKDGYIEIVGKDSDENELYNKKVLLDKSVTIATDGVSFDGSDNIVIEFDKAKGSVKSINGTSPAPGAVYKFTVTSTKNSSKTKDVTLVATTGRHYTEK